MIHAICAYIICIYLVLWVTMRLVRQSIGVAHDVLDLRDRLARQR